MIEAFAAAAVAALAAAALSQEPAAVGSFELTITTEAGAQRHVTLTCKPTGGSHPQRKPACRQLVKAKGDIAAIPPADGMCTAEYAPVTVRADGRWNGTAKEFEEVFSNRCVANRETGGHVFNF